uniref:Putative tail protein n=1 Tax=viral metagenome TaxID=1070528 RepID=A0A6H1Z9I0_9ZZZZ
MADPYYYPMDFSSQIAQHKAVTGRYQPDILEPAMRARLSAIYESGTRRKALSQQKEQFEKSLALQQEQFAFGKGQTAVENEMAMRRLRMTESEAEAQRRAAMVSGGVQLAQTGLQGAAIYGYGSQAGWWGGAGVGAGTVAVKSPVTGAITYQAAGATGALGYAAPAVAGFAAGYYGGPALGKTKLHQRLTPWGGEKEESASAGVITGAAVGAGVGSIVPGVGTLIGGIIGGVLGGVGGWVGGK